MTFIIFSVKVIFKVQALGVLVFLKVKVKELYVPMISIRLFLYTKYIVHD